MKRGLTLIFCLMISACVSQTYENWQLAERQFDNVLRSLKQDQGKDIFTKHTLTFSHSRHPVVVLATHISLVPGQGVVFLGSPGTFLIVQQLNGEIVTVLPRSNIFKELSNRQVPLFSFPAKSHLYCGYYYPDRHTTRPKPPKPEDRAIIYVQSEESLDTSHPEKVDLTELPERRLKIKSDSRYTWKDSIAISSFTKFVMWTGIPVCIFQLLFYGWILKKRLTPRFIASPASPSSMHQLYKLEGQKEFLCIHCGKPLKITGRFKCRAGHVPDKDTIIFKNCHICNDRHDKILCQHCNGVIPLYENNYIHEEIANRGKQYISRSNPLKPYFFFALSLATIMSFAWSFAPLHWSSGEPHLVFGQYVDTSLFSQIYSNIYGPSLIDNRIIGPLLCLVIIYVLLMILGFWLIPKKQILIRNPYEK